MSHIKPVLYVTLGCVIGTVISFLTTIAFAQTPPTKVRACVTNSLGVTRIVSTATNCLGTETMYEWDQNAVDAVNVVRAPFVCTWHCWFSDQASKFKGKDLSYAMMWQLEFINTDLAGTIFHHADISGDFTGSNLSNTNFSSAKLNGVLADTTLTDANLSSATISASFVNANLSTVNFTDSNVIGSDFTGATNMNTATVTGVTWATDSENYSLCPDGTNAHDNGNTCAGHLVP